jgi:hypothetical protein
MKDWASCLRNFREIPPDAAMKHGENGLGRPIRGELATAASRLKVMRRERTVEARLGQHATGVSSSDADHSQESE